MAEPLTYLKQRSGDDWLIGYDSRDFFAVAERVLGELRSRPQPQLPLTILLAERDPLTFLAHFIAACAGNCRIVLANPDWVQAEWQQVFELVQPDVIWGEAAKAKTRSQKSEVRSQEPEVRSQKRSEGCLCFPPSSTSSAPPTFHTVPLSAHAKAPHRSAERSRRSPTPHILIPTGGTSGTIRFAIHTWETLMASVNGFCQYFEVAQVNSFCVLPLYHVSGLMQFLRSFTTGGQFVVLPFKAVEEGDRSSINPEDFFLSLVPTQLQRLLDGDKSQESEARSQELEARSQKPGVRSQEPGAEIQHQLPTPHTLHPTPHTPIAWLSRFHTVFLGGAPAWASLLDRARTHHIRLAPTYGMTETASQIATLKPDDFLNGHTNAGQVLPHAQITIRDPSGDALAPYQVGAITIQSKSLAWSYHPELPGAYYQPGMTATRPSTDALLSPQISCSEGLGFDLSSAEGELGLQKACVRGEVPPTQALNEAEMPVHHSLEGSGRAFQPDDLGFFDANGYLYIVGRHSDKIITGGENVFPVEVEAAIRSTSLVQDVCVIGVSDRHWGQAIAAVYVPSNADASTATIQTALKDKLSKFKRPKHWVAVDQLPRNAQGKVNRQQVTTIANDRLSNVLATD